MFQTNRDTVVQLYDDRQNKDLNPFILLIEEVGIYDSRNVSSRPVHDVNNFEYCAASD